MTGIQTFEETERFDFAGNPYGPWPGGVSGVVRLVRRRLDVSQRALAARLGVSQSRVARWETGRTAPSAELLLQMARMAGLHVELHDESGAVHPAMRGDGARDRAGRRYPAHVDLRTSGWRVPEDASLRADYWQLVEAARRRRDPRVRFHTSAWRKDGLRAAFGQPVDHPSLEQLVAEVQFHDDAWLERRDASRRAQQELVRRNLGERHRRLTA